MSKPCLIIVHGLPATGKTSISTEISLRLKIPVFSKDALKEAMFDTIGYSDKSWSTKVSHASHRIMDAIIEQELRCEHTLMVEGNFKPDIDSERFRSICDRYSAQCLQLLCWASGDGLFERFQLRESSSRRHPAHVHPNYPREKLQELLAPGKAAPLHCAEKTIELDTSNFNRIDYPKLVNEVSSFVNGKPDKATKSFYFHNVLESSQSPQEDKAEAMRKFNLKMRVPKIR